MLIRPVQGAAAPIVTRRAAAPARSPDIEDTVTLQKDATGASARTGAETAAMALDGLLGQAAAGGVRFQHRVRFMFFNLWWKDSTPEKARDLIESGAPQRVRAEREGKRLPVELFTAPGGGDLEDRLELFELAQTLPVFEKLQSAGYSDPAKRELYARLSAEVDPWTPEGRWGEERFKDQGLVWSDSPNGQYDDGEDRSLSRELSLDGVSHARLSFRFKCQMESGPDKVRLEVARPGEEWTSLAEFTGNQGWNEKSVDLSQYDGEKVRLRFHLTSDHSVTGDGFSVTDLVLRGDGNTALALDGHHGPVETERLLALAEQASLPELQDSLALHREVGDVGAALILWPQVRGLKDRRLAVESAVAMGRELGDRSAGALLWQGLAPYAQEKDFEERRSLLTDLAAEAGVDGALATWTKLADGPGTLAQRLELDRIARLLEPEADLYEPLVQAGYLDEPGLAGLRTLTRHLAEWQTTGSWGPERVPGIGVVWSDSPDKNYKSGVNATLTRPLLLSGLSNCRLAFQASHRMEDGADKCRVEVSRDGPEWKTLETITGNRDWSRRSVDLSAYDGQSVQLRFSFQSDHSVEADGIKLADLCLESDQGSVTLQPQYEAQDRRRLVETLLASGGRAQLDRLKDATEALGDARAAMDLLPSLRPEDTGRVGELGVLVGSPRDAARLWSLLAPIASSPEYPHYRDLLVELVREQSVDEARRAFAVFALELDGAVEARADLLRVSRALVPQRGTQQELAVFEKLASAGFEDPASRQALWVLARHMQPWQAEGGWGPERVPGVGLVWSDSPGKHYGDNARANLTRPLSLVGLQGSRLELSACSRMESGSDTCRVQVSRDGKEWTTLETFTGNSDWSPRSIDLSAYDGQRLQLRFAFQSDHSVTGDGFLFHGLKLADASGRKLELSPQFQPSDQERCLAALTAPATEPERRETLQRLLRLTEVLGDSVAALDVLSQPEDPATLKKLNQVIGAPREVARLWPHLAPLRSDPDFGRVTSVAANLVVELGVDDALKVWQSFPLDGAGTMGEKLDLVETSRALASIGLQEGDVYRRLHAAGLFDAESIGRLGYLARHMQPWSAEGDWGPERVPGVGLTWSDSPGGHYRDNARASLSRPLSLAGLEKSTLRFSRAFALESSDPVTLEVTRDGREWIPLKRFTGNSDWQTEEVDLSAYDGRLLQLRFRFSSDHSVTYDGFKFHNLELTGRQAGQPVTVGLQQSFAPADTAQVLELLKQDSKPRLEWLVRASERLGDGRAALDLGLDGDLEEAAALAADLGDARGGVALWKALRPLQDPAERRAFGELLVAMASEQGVDEALRLWARADLSGAGTASERAGLYQLARAVSPERAGELYGQLQKAGLYSAESQRELISLVRQVGTWKAGGSWGTERVPGRGTVWSDSPGKQYSDNRRDSLERRLSLQGLIGSRLRFTAKHELESSDHCYLEVSSDGKEWVSRADFTGTRDWSEQRVDLSAYDGRDVWVRFRFVSDHSVVYDGISLADIRLEGTSDGSAVSERVDGRFAEGDLARLIDTVAVPGAGPAMLSAYHEAVEVAGGAGEVLPVVSVLSKVAGATPEVREASVKSVAVLARVLGAEEALRAWPRYEQMAPPEMLRATLGLGVRERLGGDLPEAGVEDLEAVWQAVREKAPAAPVAERLLDLARGAERGRLFRNLALLDPKMRERVEQVICERPSLGTNVMANVVEILVFGGMLGEDPDQTLERALQQATTDTTIAVEEDQVWVGGHPVSVSS